MKPTPPRFGLLSALDWHRRWKRALRRMSPPPAGQNGWTVVTSGDTAVATAELKALSTSRHVPEKLVLFAPATAINALDSLPPAWQVISYGADDLQRGVFPGPDLLQRAAWSPAALSLSLPAGDEPAANLIFAHVPAEQRVALHYKRLEGVATLLVSANGTLDAAGRVRLLLDQIATFLPDLLDANGRFPHKAADRPAR